jgi:hypothetical protein
MRIRERGERKDAWRSRRCRKRHVEAVHFLAVHRERERERRD